MAEILLTNEEIKAINRAAQTSLLNNPGIIGKFTKHRTDIFSISPSKKIIFIQGDEFTGLNHINLRHRFYTNSYSKTKNNSFIPTSKFKKESGKLFDYIKISESLYSKVNKDPKNFRPDTFDVYKAKVDNIQYKLILYKGTKIVHTLFPVQKGKSEKKYEKGDIVVERYNWTTYMGVIPYFDYNQEVKYSIGIKFNLAEKTEDWYILIYGNGQPFKQIDVGTLHIEYKFDIGIRILQLNHADVSQYERVMDKIDKGEIKEPP